MQRDSRSCIILGSHADVAELVDALASGASVRKYVKVQVLSSAPVYGFFRSCRLKERLFHLHFLVSASILVIGTIQTGCDTILI